MRRNRIIRAAAAALCAVMLLSQPTECAFAKANKKEQEQIDAAAEKKKKLEDEKKKTQGTINRLNNLKADVAAYMRELDNTLSEIADEIERLDGEIGTKETEVEGLKTDLAAAEETADRQFADMKLRIKYMYEKGETGFLDMLLNARNLTDFFNHAEYIEKISEYDRAQLDAYEATCMEIEQKKENVEAEIVTLEGLKTDQEAKQESSKMLLAEKQNELSKYSAQISSAENELNDYNKEIAAQEETIKAVEAQIKKREEEERKAAEAAARAAAAAAAAAEREAAAKKNGNSSSTSTVSLGDIRFRWPCPASGRITSGFGSRKSPTKGASTYHNGIDIGAPTGSAVVAAAAGEVVTATYSGSAGNYIMLSHGGGIYTLYMHCSKLSVSEGQQVKAGQTIGKVGSTGYSTGPHLHFGIRANGSYLNPSKYVSP